MIDSKAIVNYLDELTTAFENVTTDETELQQMIQQLLSYHIGDPQNYYYRELKDATKSSKTPFSLSSIMYLLERRRIVIYKGVIHLAIKSGVVAITTSTGRYALSIEFSLTETETNFLVNTINMLRALCVYQDLKTGNKVETVIPHNYSENIVEFNDCMVNMQTFTIFKKDINVIPSLVLYTNFKDNIQQDSIDKLKEFILFISDYNKEVYNRMIRILAYCYTHTVLEKMFVFLGKGRNGKGLFLKLIGTLCMGRVHAMSSMWKMRKSSSSSKESEMLEILSSKACLVEEELEFTIGLFNECYKNLADGGSETGRRLGNNAVTQRNNSVFYVATNYSNFKDVQADDYAFLNRVVFADFNNKFIDKSVRPEDHVLITEIFNGDGKILNFVNLLRLLFQELEGQDDVLLIPQIKSNYLKNDLFESVESKREEIYAAIRENPLLIEKKKRRIMVSKIRDVTEIPPTQITEAFKDVDGVKVKRINGYEKLQFSEDLLRRKITLDSDPEDFYFDDDVDLDILLSHCQEEIRVTELMYRCQIENVGKIDMTEYLQCLNDVSVRFIDEQPFVIAKPESDKIDDVIEDVEDFDFLESLCDDDKDEEVIVSSNDNDYFVSVFDQKHFPINNVDFRTRYTDKIEEITSPEGLAKEQLVKLFPYDITTRGGGENPSKILALDFDSETNGQDYDYILDTFEELGIDCYIQESTNSMKKKKGETARVKFHVLVMCNDYVYASRYKEIAEKFVSSLPFELDDHYRYRTIMNVSHHEWIHIEGELFDTIGYEDKNIERERITLSDGREIIQDKSNYSTVFDYMIDSGHESARLYLEVVYYDKYDAGNRDDTVYKLCQFLNDCLQNYNMKPSVYNEGYDRLEEIIEQHPVREGKRDLVDKLRGHRIDV